MPIAKEGSSHRNPVPVGVHHAVCYAVIDLGTQPPQEGSMYAARGPVPKVMVCWEFPSERIDVEREGVQRNMPRSLSQEYTLSLHERAGLRKMLESWRGRTFTADELKGFDLRNILGKNCLINVLHKDNGYEKIAAVMGLPSGSQQRKPENPVVLYDIGTGPLPSGIPAWIARKIDGSLERSHGTQASQPQGGDTYDEANPPHGDDDIPF